MSIISEFVGLPLVHRNACAEPSLTPGVLANSASPSSNPNGTPDFVIGFPSRGSMLLFDTRRLPRSSATGPVRS
jgi:hypothetical protein